MSEADQRVHARKRHDAIPPTTQADSRATGTVTLAPLGTAHYTGNQRCELLRYVRIHDLHEPGYAITRPDHPPATGSSQPHQQAGPDDLSTPPPGAQALSEPPRVGKERRSPVRAALSGP
jgi:hypothetical protein